MDLLTRQLRYVLRSLGRSPAFTVTAALTLALGIGATTAVFSVVRGVLLKPLAFEEPERLVGVWHEAPGMGWDRVNQSPALRRSAGGVPPKQWRDEGSRESMGRSPR